MNQFTHPKEIAKLDAQGLLNRVLGKTAIFTHPDTGKTARGEIVGGIMNPPHHQLVFRAFHVVLQDGSKITVHANTVTIKD